MQIINQSEPIAALRRVFFILLDTAGTVKQTGKAGALAGYGTKANGVTTALSGSFVELSAANAPGLYYYEAKVVSPDELDIIGPIVFTLTCPGCLDRTVEKYVGKTNTTVEANVRGPDGDDLKALSDQIDPLPTAAEVDTELAGVHGSGSWEGKEGAGSGASVVTLTVRDSVTLIGIPDVIVQVFNAALTTLLRWGLTDTNGQIVFNLDDGTYKIMLRKHGSYSFSNPETLVVSGPTTDTYDGVAFSPSAPPSPETCVVSGYTHDIGDLPISVDVEADLVEPRHFTTGGVQIIKSARTVSSAALDGYWELVLTRSGEYTAATVRYSFKINGIAMNEYLIPDQDNVDFADLPENAP